jgi:hypothetical protein
MWQRSVQMHRHVLHTSEVKQLGGLLYGEADARGCDTSVSFGACVHAVVLQAAGHGLDLGPPSCLMYPLVHCVWCALVRAIACAVQETVSGFWGVLGLRRPCMACWVFAGDGWMRF